MNNIYPKDYNQFEMTTYFSTFITGLDSVIEKLLKERVPNIKIIDLLDGLVVYSANIGVDEIRKLTFLNNSFVLLDSYKSSNSDSSLNGLVERVLKSQDLSNQVSSFMGQARHSFRIMFSKENQPVSIGNNKHSQLESQFISSKLYLDKSNPEEELMFISRKDGNSYFGLRLTRHRDYKKSLHPGELRPELAQLLCEISSPSKEDIFLDPCAGYGAIPAARIQMTGYSKIILGDIDPTLVAKISQKFNTMSPKPTIEQMDVRNLKTIKTASVNKIVTDPPWGEYQKTDSLPKTYYDMFSEFSRVLVVDGVLVILSSKKEIIDSLKLQEFKLKLVSKFDILVSGRKASIYKLVKTS